jgi:ribosomal-protein-alanine N-acetyltransferase
LPIILQTRRLILRSLAVEDLAAISAAMTADDLETLDIDEENLAPEMLETYAASVEEAISHSELVLLAISVVGEPAVIGCVELSRQASARGEAAIGYWIAEGERGRGYLSEALSRAVEFACSELALDTIRARVLRTNTQSGRALVRAGFAPAPDEASDGAPYDCYVFRRPE